MGFPELQASCEAFQTGYAGNDTPKLEKKSLELSGRQDGFCLICLTPGAQDNLFPPVSSREIHCCPRRVCRNCCKVGMPWFGENGIDKGTSEQHVPYAGRNCLLCLKRSWDMVPPILALQNSCWSDMPENCRKSVTKSRHVDWIDIMTKDSWRQALLEHPDDMSLESDRTLYLQIDKVLRGKSLRSDISGDGGFLTPSGKRCLSHKKIKDTQPVECTVGDRIFDVSKVFDLYFHVRHQGILNSPRRMFRYWSTMTSEECCARSHDKIVPSSVSDAYPSQRADGSIADDAVFSTNSSGQDDGESDTICVAVASTSSESLSYEPSTRASSETASSDAAFSEAASSEAASSDAVPSDAVPSDAAFSEAASSDAVPSDADSSDADSSASVLSLNLSDTSGISGEEQEHTSMTTGSPLTSTKSPAMLPAKAQLKDNSDRHPLTPLVETFVGQMRLSYDKEVAKVKKKYRRCATKYRRDFNKAKAEFAAATKYLRDALSANTKLRKTGEISQKEIESLKSTCRKLQQRCEELESAYKKLQDMYKDLQKVIESAEVKYGELEEQLRDSQSECKTVEEKYQHSQRKTESLELRNSKCEELLRDLQSDRKKLEEYNQQLQKEQKSLEFRNSKLEERLKDSQSDCKRMGEECQLSHKEQKSLEFRNSKLEELLGDSQSDCKTLEEKYKHSQKKTESLEFRHSKLEEQLQGSQSDCKKLSENNQHLQKEQKSLEFRNSRLEEQYQDSQSGCKKLEEKCQHLQEKSESLQVRNSKLEEQYQDSQSDYKEMEEICQDSRKKQESLEFRNSKLEEQLKDSHSDYKKLEAKYHHSQKEQKSLELRYNTLNERIQNGKLQQDGVDPKRETLKKQCQNYSIELAKAIEQIAKTEAKCGDTGSLLQETKADEQLAVDSTAMEVTVLKKIRDLEKENERVHRQSREDRAVMAGDIGALLHEIMYSHQIRNFDVNLIHVQLLGDKISKDRLKRLWKYPGVREMVEGRNQDHRPRAPSETTSVSGEPRVTNNRKRPGSPLEGPPKLSLYNSKGGS